MAPTVEHLELRIYAEPQVLSHQKVGLRNRNRQVYGMKFNWP